MDDSIHTEVIALCHICLVDEDTALGDAGGQHESRQRCQVSWLAQVSSQESVTHDDVAAQDISVPLSLPSHLA